ncbi:A24 family peptidase [Nocardioides sp. LS1]|uniref:prepilin peptidase n=1 Tax=Nocardioides sp. LS1 TaxID=1027620 RepID=UPI000F626836|nr:A24 family peptidase [Nocardioides sp. LS1]GCD88825.1 hypothetical protein NLS1_08310 [Nocardioides sp. LS1]
MSTLLAVAISALLAGLGGALVPRWVARLPEPEPDPALVEKEGPKPLYVDLAARPHLGAWAVAIAALSGALVGWAVGWDWPLVYLVPLVPVGVLLAYVDLRTRLLPSIVVVPATVVALVLVVAVSAVEGDRDALVRALVGLVAVRSFFWVLWWVRSAGMGFGDVRLSAVLGLVLGHLGWGQLLVGTYSSFLLFGVPGLALAVARRDRALLRTPYPFGPAMLAGALLGVVAGARIWSHLVAGGA